MTMKGHWGEKGSNFFVPVLHPILLFRPRSSRDLKQAIQKHLQCILVPRGCAPFGQHQELRPLASQLLNLWPGPTPHIEKIGLSQRSRFLVLTKRSAASGDENDLECWTTGDESNDKFIIEYFL